MDVSTDFGQTQQYQIPPEVFISDGQKDLPVAKWVAARNNVGGIQHLAYQVDNVNAIMQEWCDKGYAEFTTDDPLNCQDKPRHLRNSVN